MSGSSTTPLCLASSLPSYCRSTAPSVVQFTVVVLLLLLNVAASFSRRPSLSYNDVHLPRYPLRVSSFSSSSITLDGFVLSLTADHSSSFLNVRSPRLAADLYPPRSFSNAILSSLFLSPAPSSLAPSYTTSLPQDLRHNRTSLARVHTLPLTASLRNIALHRALVTCHSGLMPLRLYLLRTAASAHAS